MSGDDGEHTRYSGHAHLPPNHEVLPTNRIHDSKSFKPYMMGVGQGNHAAPPSWIQLSAVMVNVYKQLGLGTNAHNPITDNIIHSMGAMFIDDLDIYTWKDIITDPVKLMLQAQREVSQWRLLPSTNNFQALENVIATGNYWVCFFTSWVFFLIS
jgi:hypothetical protein